MASFGSKMRSLTPIAKKPKSEVDQMVQEALSKDKWNAPNSLLHNLAVRTLKDPSAKDAILPPVWKLLEASSKEWRRAFKALALVEALLKRASMQTVEDIRQNVWKAAKWREQKVIEDGKDVGGGMREKARVICELCEDASLLSTERKKHHEITQKMHAMRGPKTAEADKENTNILQRTAAAVAGKALAPSTPRSSQKEEEPSGFHAFAEADMEAAAVERDGTGGRKPEFKELRNRCATVQQATGMSAGHAMQLLKETNWDANQAIFAAGLMAQNQPDGNTKGTEDSDSDESDSDSDSDSSDDDSPAPAHAGKGGKAAGKGGPKGGHPASGNMAAKGFQPGAKGMPAGGKAGSKGGWSAGKGAPQQLPAAAKGGWESAGKGGAPQSGKMGGPTPSWGGKGGPMSGKGGPAYAPSWQQQQAVKAW